MSSLKVLNPKLVTLKVRASIRGLRGNTIQGVINVVDIHTESAGAHMHCM